MRTVKVLGTGCPKCKTLEERSRQAVAELGIECDVVKVSDLAEISGFGVFMTPALVVDGEVKTTGKLLSVEEIKQLLG